MRIAYDTIPKAEEADTYLEAALVAGRRAADRVKHITDKTALAKAKEKDRIRAIRERITTPLERLHDAYPSFDGMHEFTRQVFALDLDIGRVRQALAGVQGTVTTLKKLAKDYVGYITGARDKEQVLKMRNAYLGRTASILRQADKHFRMLNEARAVFRALPVVDESLFTVAIAGFPNVGKSTLLRKLTTAKPEVAPYAFTTKGLNVGYFEHLYNRIQCIDTPGTLNREKMNAVEKKADVTNRYLAHVIVYVFDPTEGSYPLADQERLYAHLLELDKEVLVYVSKTDLVDASALVAKYDGFTDADALKKAIVKKFRAWV